MVGETTNCIIHRGTVGELWAFSFTLYEVCLGSTLISAGFCFQVGMGILGVRDDKDKVDEVFLSSLFLW